MPRSGQIRGLVAEYGLVAPQTVCPLRAAIPVWLEDAENGLTDRFPEKRLGAGARIAH